MKLRIDLYTWVDFPTAKDAFEFVSKSQEIGDLLPIIEKIFEGKAVSTPAVTISKVVDKKLVGIKEEDVK